MHLHVQLRHLQQDLPNNQHQAADRNVAGAAREGGLLDMLAEAKSAEGLARCTLMQVPSGLQSKPTGGSL